VPVVLHDGSVEFALDAEHMERNAWLDAILENKSRGTRPRSSCREG
jgi:hypothetical protein